MLSTVTNQTMSSREIAELTNKNHSDVLHDIRLQLYSGLYNHDFDKGKILYPEIQGLTVVVDDQTKRTKEILLDRHHSDILVSGYEVKYRAAIVKRWHELEAMVAPAPITKIVDPKLAALVESLVRIDQIEQEQSRIVEEQKQLKSGVDTLTNRLDQIETATHHFTVAGWCNLVGHKTPTLEQAARMGKQATKECKDRGLDTGKVPDPRFGVVKTYPKFILDELFLD